MKIFFLLVALFLGLSLGEQATFLDGVLTSGGPAVKPADGSRLFVVVDSFASPMGYSMGLGCDGYYIWNDEAWSRYFARIDPVTHAVVNTFTPTYGNRDMAFDGTYLWASDWETYRIYKYDTSNCAILATYDPGFSGHAHGMAWDGNFLWVGEESGRIYKMNTTGDTIRSIPSPGSYPSDPRGLAFADGHLWVGHQGYGRIYEIDTITGAILNYYSAPGVVPGWRFQQGLDYGGSYLWSTSGGSVNMIYKIDIGMVNVEEHRPISEVKTGLSIKPNPLNHDGRINFTILKASVVKISVTDAAGRVAAEILGTQLLDAGDHQYRWQADKCPPGVYFVILRVNNINLAAKIIKL
ncbi:MAG TPA: T9SS type A sorting domain-containing protein [bacterium]